MSSEPRSPLYADQWSLKERNNIAMIRKLANLIYLCESLNQNQKPTYSISYLDHLQSLFTKTHVYLLLKYLYQRFHIITRFLMTFVPNLGETSNLNISS